MVRATADSDIKKNSPLPLFTFLHLKEKHQKLFKAMFRHAFVQYYAVIIIDKENLSFNF